MMKMVRTFYQGHFVGLLQNISVEKSENNFNLQKQCTSYIQAHDIIDENNLNP